MRSGNAQVEFNAGEIKIGNKNYMDWKVAWKKLKNMIRDICSYRTYSIYVQEHIHDAEEHIHDVSNIIGYISSINLVFNGELSIRRISSVV